jgi:hypothetical protein
VPIRVAMDMIRVTGAKLPTGVYTDAKLFDTWVATKRLPLPEQPGAREAKQEVTAG